MTTEDNNSDDQTQDDGSTTESHDDQTADDTDTGDDSTDWKAEARKWEARAKENSNAAARLKEIQDAEMSDLERVTGERDSEKERADTAEAQVARLTAVIEHGLSKDALDLLDPRIPEAERAKKLAELVGVARETRDRSPDPRLGRTDHNESSKDALGRALFGV